ncbi:hypothetical protein [Segniliparus rugosus]|uniref:Asp23/Gls24 family envelope stress response protein n=1 Tax=Segniliparus rugosus (strain ATCC BAA-974 / DSM 45345 / CCUG 50838 / CIP 108380 / JCM 13579 / CDC 945) TaxID=679197 RepID=E5XNI1_SEGRC|nr:hypothetical protein [Segniliparus rugosus]EFV14093.1 hypothetical protein HMPREF9336_01010 [Segniliparus rugosus ATCC BAA-974]
MSQSAAESVDRLVAAITAIDGVVGLYSGGAGAPATHLPGRTVQGVRLGPAGGQVQVVLELREGLIDLADHVRHVASEVAGVPVDVVVGDVALPDSAQVE